VTTLSVPVHQRRSGIYRLTEHLNSGLEAHFWGCAAILVLVFFAVSVVQDLRLKMWNDEIVTLYVAQQGSPTDIVKATRDGMDNAPPLYPILVSAILPFFKPDALAVRLPSTLGFVAMLMFVLGFCRRRVSGLYAFIAALLAFISCAFYATEGRSYGLVLGCVAGALFCWQGAVASQRRALWLASLSFCVAFATALHFYSVCLLLPLAAGELLRLLRQKKMEYSVFLAMLPAILVLVIHYPLIAASRKYLAHFWAPGVASWHQVPDFYLQFALAPAAVMLVGLIAVAIRPDSGEEPAADRPALPAYEWLAVGILALAPIVVIFVSRYTTHVFLLRYTAWAAIGLAILSASVLYVCCRAVPLVGVAVFAVLLAIVMIRQTRSLREEPKLRQGDAIFRQLQSVPDGAEPVVIAYDHAFMELSYYAAPALRERLVYPLDRTLELRYSGADLDYLLLSGMRAHTRLKIVDLATLLNVNPHFILAARPNDYLPEYLRQSGYRLTPIGSETEAVVYKVGKP